MSATLGRPVISTYVAGIPELVVPRESGWLVPAGNVDALVDSMTEALALAPESLDRMAAEGARRVRELHGIRDSAMTLSSLMKEAAA